QHRRFRELHAREPFARQYMEGIGHFEFGGALRPIAFGELDPAGADRAEFWVRYWVQAYDRVLQTAGPRTVFVDQDALCLSPRRGLARLAEAIGIADPATLAAHAGMLRPPRPVPDLPDVPAALRRQARELHDMLCRRAVNQDTAAERE